MIDMSLITLILVGSIFVLVLFVLVFFMKMDSVVRAKFKAMISRKPYGVAYFHLANIIYPRIVRFDESFINLPNAKYIINKDAIYIQKMMKGGILDKNKVTYSVSEFITHQQGVPTIHFDYNNLIPLKFGEYDSSKIPNPIQVQAIFRKELELAEAEMMYHNRDTLKKFLIIVIVLVFVMIGIQAFSLIKLLDVIKLVTPV